MIVSESLKLGYDKCDKIWDFACLVWQILAVMMIQMLILISMILYFYKYFFLDGLSLNKVLSSYVAFHIWQNFIIFNEVCKQIDM